MEYKLEKGKKYNLSHYEDGIEGEFVGVLRKNYGNNNYYYKLVFKLRENSFCVAEPEAKIREDGTINVAYDVYEFKNTIEDFLKPPVRQETIELI